jgi:WD40 repeat protein
VVGVAYSADGKRIAAGGHDQAVLVWDADGRGEPLLLRGHRGGVLNVAFGPDGTRLYSAGEDGLVKAWDVPR